MLHTGSTFARSIAVVALPLFCFALSVSGQDLSVNSINGVTTVTANGKPLLEYQSQPHPTKIYVSRWYTPKGQQVLRDSPHDHVHHHALMYAIGIDGVDFWAEVPPEEFGRQVSNNLAAHSAVDSRGRGEVVITQSVQWTSPTHEVLAQEAREIHACMAAIPNASLLTWQLTLSAAEGKDSIQLWGRHYFGLGMRFVESMDEGSEFLLPPGTDGVVVRGTEKLTRAPWCAVHGTSDGQPITVAMFDASENVRHPASWFTMNAPFAYMAATLNLHEEPLTVEDAVPLRLRYGIAAWDGTIDEKEIEQAYQIWLKLQ